MTSGKRVQIGSWTVGKVKLVQLQQNIMDLKIFEHSKFGDVANNDSAHGLIRAPCPGKKPISIHLSF